MRWLQGEYQQDTTARHAAKVLLSVVLLSSSNSVRTIKTTSAAATTTGGSNIEVSGNALSRRYDCFINADCYIGLSNGELAALSRLQKRLVCDSSCTGNHPLLDGRYCNYYGRPSCRACHDDCAAVTSEYPADYVCIPCSSIPEPKEGVTQGPAPATTTDIETCNDQIDCRAVIGELNCADLVSWHKDVFCDPGCSANPPTKSGYQCNMFGYEQNCRACWREEAKKVLLRFYPDFDPGNIVMCPTGTTTQQPVPVSVPPAGTVTVPTDRGIIVAIPAHPGAILGVATESGVPAAPPAFKSTTVPIGTLPATTEVTATVTHGPIEGAGGSGGGGGDGGGNVKLSNSLITGNPTAVTVTVVRPTLPTIGGAGKGGGGATSTLPLATMAPSSPGTSVPVSTLVGTPTSTTAEVTNIPTVPAGPNGIISVGGGATQPPFEGVAGGGNVPTMITTSTTTGSIAEPVVKEQTSVAPQAPAPAGGGEVTAVTQKPATASLSAFAQAALNQHNTFRADHCVPDMMWDEDVARVAQGYADYLCTAGKGLVHSTNDYGENLAWFSEGWNYDDRGYVTACTQSWYNEVNNCPDRSVWNGCETGTNGVVGHFTQLVWDTSTSLGCGLCDDIDGVFVVCNYDAPGNYRTTYAEHVFPVKVNGVCI